MKTAWVLTALVLCAGFLGCGRNEPRSTNASTPVWTCLTGTQGGFTGGGGGYEIHSDGRAWAWSRLTADAEVDKRPLGQVQPEQLLPLVAALAVEELYRIDLQESGNMTTFLEVRSTQHPTKRWSWPADRMGGRAVKVPQPVQNAYEAASAITRTFDHRR